METRQLDMTTPSLGSASIPVLFMFSVRNVRDSVPNMGDPRSYLYDSVGVIGVVDGQLDRRWCIHRRLFAQWQIFQDLYCLGSCDPTVTDSTSDVVDSLGPSLSVFMRVPSSLPWSIANNFETIGDSPWISGPDGPV